MRDATSNVQRILLLGGTSEIGVAIARRFVTKDRLVDVVVAARPGTRRAAASAMLQGAGARTLEVDFDATERASWQSSVNAAFDAGDVDLAVVAFGLLGDQQEAWQQLDAALRLAQVNYVAAVGVGVLLSQRLRQQGHGSLVALSSVAGERPRRANFVYGSTKAGMDAFYTGLGEALRADGVHVMVVRPGFVHTRMTAGLRPPPLSQTPEQVAQQVFDGVFAGRQTVWVPGRMRWAMSALRHLPRGVFRRLPV